MQQIAEQKSDLRPTSELLDTLSNLYTRLGQCKNFYEPIYRMLSFDDYAVDQGSLPFTTIQRDSLMGYLDQTYRNIGELKPLISQKKDLLMVINVDAINVLHHKFNELRRLFQELLDANEIIVVNPYIEPSKVCKHVDLVIEQLDILSIHLKKIEPKLHAKAINIVKEFLQKEQKFPAEVKQYGSFVSKDSTDTSKDPTDIIAQYYGKVGMYGGLPKPEIKLILPKPEKVESPPCCCVIL